jgi:Cu(I)/Ag(I) efflux system membrane fusion protein
MHALPHSFRWLAVILAAGATLIVALVSPASRPSAAEQKQVPADDAAQMPGMRSKPESGSAREVPGHAVVMISPTLQQAIGIRVGVVKSQSLTMAVQTVGIIRPDETRIARIHLKVEGWVEQLLVNYTGQLVKQGEPLLGLYSPQYLSTEQEYLTARRGTGGAESRLAQSALERLKLWDVPKEEIEHLEQTGEPTRVLTLRSPVSGTVLEKDVFQGEYLTPQRRLYSIADLSTVWVQAKVYEYELPHIALGQSAKIAITTLPSKNFTGNVVFIAPTLNEETRTAEVRVELENPDGELKPGMFAEVTIEHDMGQGLLVPHSAVLRTGQRAIAYREGSDRRFEPVEVGLDPFTYEDRFHIVSGLEAGDRIVLSATFLIDSESRLRANMGGMSGMNMPGMK